MAFDQTTRNRLQRFVTEARRTLEEEFTRQLQNDYGMDPVSGTVAPPESLRHINDQQRETARILRDTLAHYCASPDTDTKSGLDRIVREQAFTVLNRLAALRMAEARGLLYRKIAHLGPFENFVHVGNGVANNFANIWTVGEQSASLRPRPPAACQWKLLLCGKLYDARK
jgi:hypothetical protein